MTDGEHAPRGEHRYRVVYLCGGPLHGRWLPLQTPDVRVVQAAGITYMQSPASNVFTPSGLTAAEVERRESAARGKP